MTGDTGGDTVRLTYAQLARRRGVSVGAAKRMAQRHRWPRQLGNDGLTRISVPATYVERRETVPDDVTDDVAADVTGDIALVVDDVTDDVADDVASHIEGIEAVSLDEALAAFAGIVRDVTGDVVRDVTGDVIPTLREQLQTERERANRAEMQVATERERADRAEGRVQELQQKLDAEIEAHRQVVESLVARIPTRRSWLLWRRRSAARRPP